jgi:diphthine-ammonia ligase
LPQNVFVSWSGGKDCYLALQKAVEQELTVTALTTFVNREGHNTAHGVDTAVLRRQASALGLPLEIEPVTWEEYEKGFLNVVARLKKEGVTGGVFGDINLQEHRQWIETRCRRQSITPFFPLWGMEETDVVRELLRRKARLLIVALRGDLLDEEWIGRELDEQFLQLCLERGLSPCGENGEYHTLAIGGPLFQEHLEFERGAIRQQDNLLYQDLKNG